MIEVKYIRILEILEETEKKLKTVDSVKDEVLWKAAAYRLIKEEVLTNDIQGA